MFIASGNGRRRGPVRQVAGGCGAAATAEAFEICSNLQGLQVEHRDLVAGRKPNMEVFHCTNATRRWYDMQIRPRHERRQTRSDGMGLADEFKVDPPCPNCGIKLDLTVREVHAGGGTTCPACGAKIKFEVEGGDAAGALDQLEDAFKRLGN